ncbi:MAG TPA: family 1 glycosylhydrolase [Acidimicrobiales bacterium]|nr:family 1 glycosylhydrolase [Acidimicrobiales bacterium]
MLAGMPPQDPKAASSGRNGAGVLPDGFRFGVATAGFQVEGGFNGHGEPTNNWVRWERAGRVEPSGIAVDFWNRYEDHLDRVAALGCDAFRLGVEWARVEPSPGVVDDTALDRYAAVLDACHERAIEPLVTLHHFTHPAWLGEDFWLSTDSPEHFSAWVELAVGRLHSRCRNWVTLNEINVVGMGSYLLGMFPPGRYLALSDMARAFDNLVAAHVRGYEVIHRLQPDATVTTNNTAVSVYELDRMLIDLVLARGAGIARDDIGAYLAERRSSWYASLPAPDLLEQGLRRVGRKLAASPGETFRAAIDALWASPHDRPLDVIGIDYYDPVASHHARLPGARTAGGRSWAPGRELWDDLVDPPGLDRYCRANATEGLDLWVVENGLCNRVRRGRSYPRLDRWDRIRYLRANLASVVDAIANGVPLGAYYHWSLTDNYEWGSYEPRFGIHAVDRERGIRILDNDALGADAAGTYRSIIEGLRSGDRSVVGVIAR